jgi:hypothetical protein
MVIRRTPEMSHTPESASAPALAAPANPETSEAGQTGVLVSGDLLGALREMHAGDPIFVERKRDFLNLYTESDAVIATMAGQVIEYEIKVSRADYVRDRFKLRNKIYSGEKPGDRPNRFYYVTPPAIITEADLPAWAGWYELLRGTLTLRRKAPKLHKDCHGVTVLMRLARAMRKRT